MAREYREDSSTALETFAARSWMDDFGAKLALDNQAGESRRHFQTAVLVAVEIVGAGSSNNDESREPVKDLSFSMTPTKSMVVHQGELEAKPQKLAIGGTVAKKGEKIEIDLPNSDHIVFDARSGAASVESYDRYQREVHFKGTDWQKTVLTSDHNTRVILGKDRIRSVESDGVLEVFPAIYSKHVGVEPRTPASEELGSLFAERGRADLLRALTRVDKQTESALASGQDGSGQKEVSGLLSSAMMRRAELLDRAAELAPGLAVKYRAAAENELRNSLAKMRELYGAGTPETRDIAEALQKHLKAEHASEQDEEIDRLGFEARRGYLMKSVVDNIENAGVESAEAMPRSLSNAIRASLISIHIATGDSGLKDFVSDVNKRLSSQELHAPVLQSGFVRHGAIILTPEGATRYNGAFELSTKN